MSLVNRKIFNVNRLFIFGLWLAFLAVGTYAQSYPCVNAIYFSSYSNTNVYKYTPSTNAITLVAGYSIANPSAASAVMPDGSRLYYADNGSSLRYNSGNATNVLAASGLVSNAIQRNGINSTGTGYFMQGGAGSGTYYQYTTGGATSVVSGPFNLTVQPATAPALGNGGDITFDSNGIGYLLDQAKNLYRLDFTNNVANYLGAITGIAAADNPNGLGFAQTNSGTYELYVSTLNNTFYRINLATSSAVLVSPTSTVGGFTQNDIASCIYPPGIVPNIAATKAWRNVTKGDPNTFTTSTAASLGDTLEYRVVVRNSGAIAAGNTMFQDTLPSGLNYVALSTTLNGLAVTDNAASGNAAFAYGTAKNIQGAGQLAGSGVLVVDSTPANIADNEATVIFRVTVSSPFTGIANPVPNTAQITYAGAASAVSSNTTTTPLLLPDLTIAKAHTGNFTRGLTGVYTITVTNAGTASTSGTITVLDNLPTGLSVNGGGAALVTLSGTNAANWTCNSNALSPQTITCTSSTAISSTAGSNTSVFTFTVNVAAAAAASVTNTASVSGGGEQTLNNGNNTASDPTTTVSAPPSIALAKSCAVLVGSTPTDCATVTLQSGTEMTYTIVFTNSGAQAAASFAMTDPNPAIGTLKLNTNTDFKIGTVSNTLPTGLTGATITYSSDSAVSFVYTPVSQGGGAAVGFDRNVTHIRWTFVGSLSQTSPNNTGSVSFTVKIR